MRLCDQGTTPTDGPETVSACSTPEVEDPVEEENSHHEGPDFDDILDVPHYMKPVLIKFAKRWPNKDYEDLAVWFHKRFLKTIAADVVQGGYSKPKLVLVISSSECWLTWRCLVAILEQGRESNVEHTRSGGRKAKGKKAQYIHVRIGARRPCVAECASDDSPTATSNHETPPRRKASTKATTPNRNSATQAGMTTGTTASGRPEVFKVNFERRVLRSHRRATGPGSQPAEPAQLIYASRKVGPCPCVDIHCHGRESSTGEVKSELPLTDVCH
jgi:hypothetical protein